MKKIVYLLFISVFLVTGCSVKKADEVTDAEIFASEYAISKDNVFTYASIDEVVQLLEEDTGIIFFGNSDQEYCSSFVKIFSKLVEEKEINEVYYYDPTVIRDDGTEDYDMLLDLLGSNLTVTEEGDSYLTIPSVYFVRDGEIVGYNADNLVFEFEDEELEKFEKDLEEKYLELLEEYISDNDENID